MTDNKGSQLFLPGTTNRENTRDLLLVPYAAVNLARILTGCYLRGTATGVNVPDAQSTSDDFLVAFENAVPLWAIDLCKQDDSDVIVVCLDPGGLEIEEQAGHQLIACPVSTRSIAKIVADRSGKSAELISRIGRMPDVPWKLIESYDDPSCFDSRQPDGPDSLAQAAPQSNLTQARLRGLDSMGGVVAAHLSALRRSAEFDDWIQLLYEVENVGLKLGRSIYEIVNGAAEKHLADSFVWDIAWDYVGSRDARQGFSSEHFLAHAEQKEKEAPNRTGEQYLGWINYCDSIISAERDFPVNWKDSDNPAMRAVLVFLLTQSRDKLTPFFNQYGVGKRVRFLAESIAAHFETIKRIPTDEKAPGRTALDALSNTLVKISYGKNVSLEIGDDAFNGDGHINHEVRLEGTVIASRTKPIDLIYTELFAKARRVSMEHGFDSGRGLFFIEQAGTSGACSNSLRLLICLEDHADNRPSRRARFFTPVATFSNSRAPAAARLKAFLETAWNHELAVGLQERNGEYEVSFFWSQMVDTFDVAELVDMLDRFRSALRS